MEHHQNVDRPQNDTPGWCTTVWCASTNCSNSNFKTTPNLPIPINFTNPLRKTFYLQIYPPDRQKIYKTVQNIDIWDERRDF